jgi:nucleoid-associated protein YgaU
VAEEKPAPKETKAAAVAVVTDTVRHNHYLTTMARQHYGRMEYWVYIYQENAASLGDPDLVEAGTVVVIPPAEKYGLSPTDKAKINEASRLATEIYAKYKK